MILQRIMRAAIHCRRMRTVGPVATYADMLPSSGVARNVNWGRDIPLSSLLHFPSLRPIPFFLPLSSTPSAPLPVPYK